MELNEKFLLSLILNANDFTHASERWRGLSIVSDQNHQHGSNPTMISRLIIYGIAFLAIAGVVWAGVHVWNKAQRLDQVEREYSDYRESVKKLQAEQQRQLKIAQEASHAYQTDLRRLESERHDVPVVRLCKSKPQPVPAESGTSAGSDAATSGHVGGETPADIGPDIGAELIEYGIACEANALQLERLQEWVRAR
jgi:hypothetical protein